ncbi:MAG: hypothetical protein KDA28_00725, partial [Phycisphaerales bacterium]|nr:hypothetical protein [Phycisphaerales bacterium]
MNTLRIAMVAALAGTAVGQDSVSVAGGLPGDALSPFNGAQVRKTYVLDLSPGTTSWGNAFGVAPILKLSKSSQTFYNSLGSAHYLSQTELRNVPYASQGYAYWNTPGGGVNENRNNLDGNQTVNPSGASTQFSAMIAEFGFDNGGVSYNGVIGAVANYDPSDPSRLFVTRVHGAVNEAANGAGDTAQFGAGSCDAAGNIFWRADSFGATGAPAIAGQNWFSVP